MKIKEMIHNLRFAMHMIYDSSGKLITLRISYAFFQGLYSVYSLLVLKIILELVFQEESLATMGLVLVVMFLISFGIESLCDTIITYLIPQEELKVSKYIEGKLYDAMVKKDIQQLDDPLEYNHFFFSVRNGKESILNLLVCLSDIIARVITIFGLTTFLVTSHMWLICFVLAYLAISLFIDMLNSKNSYKKNVSLIPVNRRLDYVNRIFYLKQYALELRAFPLMKSLKKKMFDWYSKKEELQNHYNRKQVNYHIIKVISSLLFQMSSILYIGNLSLKNIIQNSDFLVLYNGTSELSDSLNSLIQFLPLFYENSLYIGEIKEFLEDNQEIDKYDETIDIIELKNISFRYPLHDNLVLNNVNFQFQKNQSYAVIGINGSGKTTLAKIIGNLFYKYQGNVLINGKGVDTKDYIDRVSFIFQDYQIYSLSIAENILMHPIETKHDEDTVIDILKKVNLYDKVMLLPNNIYTEMTSEFNEESVMFSGGELQKIALGRSIAKDCDILILDEPSSALDVLSESEFLLLAKELARNKILIYITHKLDRLSLFDRIICIENGEIVEDGTYEELFNKGEYLSSLIYQSNI